MTTFAPRPASLLFELPDQLLSAAPKPVDPESFADLGVLEVQHIEKWLAAVPEVLGEELLVVTTQFAGFDKTKERSDILALDRAGRLVVIELKRDTSGSRQDLRESWDMDVSCIELVPYRLDDKLLITSSVRIPLPEAAEYTVKRDRKRQKAQTGPKVDWAKAMKVMAAIPPGHWMSYADLAAAAGGSRGAAMAVGNYLLKADELPPDCVHRVLRGDGRVASGWQGEIGGPEDAQSRLEAEGLAFPNGRADKARRWAPPAI